MKKMVLAIIAFAMCTTMMAQDGKNKQPQRKPGNKTEMVKQRTAQMVERYGLNEKQAEQLQTLNAEFADKMAPQMRNGRPQGPGGRGQMNRGQRPRGEKFDSTRAQQRPERRPEMKPEEMDSLRAVMRATRDAYDEGLKSIMSEEQFQKYKADEQKRQGEGRQGRPQRNR